MTVMEALHVYDTTLRDGAQQEGLNLSVSDKLAIAGLLDDLGVDFIEGGWPGANPKDTEFFARARTELPLRHATLAAFGATRRAGGVAAQDVLVQALLDSGAPVVCLVAKSHVRHVEEALKTTLEENLADGARHREPPRRAGSSGLPRRRALLRRVAARPRLRPLRRPDGARGGRRGRRPLRHQRGDAPSPGRGGRRRRHQIDRCPDRCPLPQRHRLCRSELRGRRPSRRDPRPGHRSTATASAPATPTCSLSCPTSSSSSATT